ncbi:hypothetical protein CI102_12271 [Trichoderma harzianum]|nr:hypothetical protein CI102_12271 [Trichoderma harzianum]
MDGNWLGSFDYLAHGLRYQKQTASLSFLHVCCRDSSVPSLSCVKNTKCQAGSTVAVNDWLLVQRDMMETPKGFSILGHARGVGNRHTASIERIHTIKVVGPSKREDEPTYRNDECSEKINGFVGGKRATWHQSNVPGFFLQGMNATLHVHGRRGPWSDQFHVGSIECLPSLYMCPYGGYLHLHQMPLGTACTIHDLIFEFPGKAASWNRITKSSRYRRAEGA